MECCEWRESVRKPSVFHKHKLQVSHRRKCENPSLQFLEESIYKSDLGCGSDFLGKTPKEQYTKGKTKYLISLRKILVPVYQFFKILVKRINREATGREKIYRDSL